MGDEQLTEEQIADASLRVTELAARGTYTLHRPSPRIGPSREDLVDDLARGSEDVVH